MKYEAPKMRAPRCTYDRVSSPGTYSYSRCWNPAKHDPDEDGNPTRCGIHSAAAKARRKAKSDAQYEKHRQESLRRSTLANLRAEAMTIVRQIAEGHNDPRGLAGDWVSRFEKSENGQ